MLSRGFCWREAAPVGSSGLGGFLILFLFLVWSSCIYPIDGFSIGIALDRVDSRGIKCF